MRKAITKRSVDTLKSGEVVADTEIRGFVARRLPSGVVTYGLRYTDKTTGARRWMALGLHGNLTPDKARDLAQENAGLVAGKRDPHAETRAARRRAKEAQGTRFGVLADEFIKRYAKPSLRTWEESERILNKYVRPSWGERPVAEITRLDVTELLDRIEDQNGPVMADRVLAVIRKLFNWQAARSHTFMSPIVRGMGRTKPTERARSRVLGDDELRAFWMATAHEDVAAVFGPACRFVLLSAQRPGECFEVRRRSIDQEHVWKLDAGAYKNKRDHFVPLSDAAVEILDAMPKPKRDDADYIFTTTGGRAPFSGRSKAKRKLDAAMLAALRDDKPGAKLEPWVLHDLRRTARSLMSRAGVSADIAERVLGHVIPGVRGVYDRHSYLDEKRETLKALAGLADRIVSGKAATVIPLRKAVS